VILPSPYACLRGFVLPCCAMAPVKETVEPWKGRDPMGSGFGGDPIPAAEVRYESGGGALGELLEPDPVLEARILPS
jgi:hypothetical protein